MNTIHSNNKLIRKKILSMFGGSLAAMITSAIALMTDTILAGVFFDKYAIAAVAVGTPIINIFQALTQTIINGASIHMNICAGKGENEEVRRSFSVGILFTLLFGVFFILACQVFASKLVFWFGGSEEVATLATWYLRGATGCILLGNVNLFMTKTLALFGQQKVIFRSAFLAVAFNVLFSMLMIKLLPENMAIMGLGMGTWMGGTMGSISSYISLRKYNLSLKGRMADIKFSTLKKFVRNGLPSSGNNLADGVVSGVVNNLIIRGLAEGVLALSVFTAVKSIVTFATAIIQAIMLSAAPLFGIMYGARDRSGILRSYRESLRLAMISLGITAVFIMGCSPLFAKIYDMQGIRDFYIGLAICAVVYLPLTALLRITTQFFESMEKPLMGFVYSAIPDSMIFPALLALLLPVWGYKGLWIAYGLNAIPFLLALYLVRSVKNRSLTLSYNRIFCLDKEIRDNVPKIDISINSDNRDVSFISGEVHHFLTAEGIDPKKAYATALCLEELAVDFVEHTVETDSTKDEDTIMDIKLFVDEDMLRIIIRNEAPMYNPLDYAQNTENVSKIGVNLAKKFAHSIQYNYVYQINIVTIDILR